MLVDETVVFTFVVSLGLVGHVSSVALSPRHAYPVAANNFTLEQYIGVWFEIGVIYPPDQFPSPKCEWFEIKSDGVNSGGFIEVYRKPFNDKGPKIINGYGRVIDSGLRVLFPDFSSRVQAFTVHGYNNGDELILIDQSNLLYSGLISRRNTASIKARAELERLAWEATGHVMYVDHNNCHAQ